VQKEEPEALEKVPGAHIAHVDGEVAPITAENLPAAHGEHALLPEKDA
jgi:hypothetical protein